MTSHLFLFSSSLWIGQGRLLLPSFQNLPFYTKWEVEAINDQSISWRQYVVMTTLGSQIENKIVISNIAPNSFTIALENELFGSSQGIGIIDKEKIAWEFHAPSELEGFEVYQLQENGDYKVHAEYLSKDHVRTIIDGLIWKK